MVPARGTPMIQAPTPMPVASIAAITTVPRAYPARFDHESVPASSTWVRAPGGNSEVTQPQIRGPSWTKKMVANRAMPAPLTTSRAVEAAPNAEDAMPPPSPGQLADEMGGVGDAV